MVIIFSELKMSKETWRHRQLTLCLMEKWDVKWRNCLIMGLGRSHLPELTDVSRMNSQHAAEPLQCAVMEAKNFGLLISLTVNH